MRREGGNMREIDAPSRRLAGRRKPRRFRTAASKIAEDGLDVDDAIALIGQVPGTSTAVDTSMQTDAYDLDETSFFTEDLPAERTSPDDEDPNATAPLQMDDWAAQRDEAENETDAAADAALRRWASS